MSDACHAEWEEYSQDGGCGKMADSLYSFAICLIWTFEKSAHWVLWVANIFVGLQITLLNMKIIKISPLHASISH